MADFRDQIIQTQNVRSDLMKWKLILVAGLGGAAIGINSAQNEHPRFLLALIPIACVYVDALCAHLWLRINGIEKFLSISEFSSSLERDYENFLTMFVPKWKLESLALHVSTLFISGIIFIAGLWSSVKLNPYPEIDFKTSKPEDIGIILAGLLGFVMTIIIRNRYNIGTKNVDKAATRWQEIHGVKGNSV
ncbi:MAG: hypothetical protein HGB15_04905 [Chlorobaculum sp.]|nr:hypothetical protein [Chlorobaculum sp.]